MKNTTLIIPSAKVVPKEMQNIGKIPAILYPLNEGIVLDYMLKQYKDITRKIEIVAFEKSEEVINRNACNYNRYNIEIVTLNTLKDLGYTIYEGLVKNSDVSSGKVIINFADTIVMDQIDDIQGDCYFYSEDYVSDKWTFFQECNGKINHIIDKKQRTNLSDKKMNLFVGVFKIEHPLDFIQCLEFAFTVEKEMDSFYIALLEYTKLHPMTALKTDKWFDIGHADKYFNSKLGVSARAFNHITIDKERGILKKTSDNKEKFRGEVLWYIKLPRDIEYVRPRIFSYSTNYSEMYIDMEYYSYHTVHELFLYGDLTYNQWVDIFDRIKFMFKDFAKYRVSDGGIQPALEDIYLTKTLQRLSDLKNNPSFKTFFTKHFSVNGIKYKSLDRICEILKLVIPQELYNVSDFNIIHGDLCFANILVDGKFSFIKVIDPRGTFGKFDIYGDPRYELAKLFHSVDGKYDCIIKDMFTVNIEPNSIDFKIKEKQREFDLFECLLECFNEEIGIHRKEIELIEALLFLSMIPLHTENVDRQHAMLATGISILDRCADIRD